MNDPVAEFKTWYFQKPKFTRTYLTAAMILTILISLKMLSITYVYHSFAHTIGEFQLWRPFLSVLDQGPFGFGLLFSMWMAFFGLSRVETDLFSRDTYADFLWLMIYLFLGISLIGLLVPIYITSDGFIFSCIYIWCKRRPFETISLMFGFQCKSGYLPWVMLALRVLMGANLWGFLGGLLMGHSYIVLKDIFIPKYHKDYLATPAFFKRLVYGERQRMNLPRGRADQPFGGRGVRLE